MKIKLDRGAFPPERAHDLDAGYDLKTPKGRILNINSICKIDTGVHVELPKGTVGYIKNRSSMFSRGIVTDGTIDPGYTGPIKVVLHNNSGETQLIKRGEKIAQLVIHPIHTPELEEVDELAETERGDGGFGSTGR